MLLLEKSVHVQRNQRLQCTLVEHEVFFVVCHVFLYVISDIYGVERHKELYIFKYFTHEETLIQINQVLSLLKIGTIFVRCRLLDQHFVVVVN